MAATKWPVGKQGGPEMTPVPEFHTAQYHIKKISPSCVKHRAEETTSEAHLFLDGISGYPCVPPVPGARVHNAGSRSLP